MIRATRRGSGKRPTELRPTAPSSVKAGSAATFSARLLSPEGPASGRTVLLQRQDPSGWVQVGTMTTRADGLAQQALGHRLVGAVSRRVPG